MVAVIGCANLLAHLLQPDRWTEIAQQVVVFFYDRVDLVAQTQIEREIPGGAPVVLDESGVAPIVDVSSGIAYQQAGGVGKAGEVGFKRCGRRERKVCRVESEFDSAARAAVRAAAEGVAVNFASELDGVFAELRARCDPRIAHAYPGLALSAS